MSPVQKLKDQIVQWNIRFPLDREYRKKHNVTFGSTVHREINQVDLLFDHLEDTLYKEVWKEAEEQVKMERQYAEGKWMKEIELTQEDELSLFDQLKVSNFDNIQIEED